MIEHSYSLISVVLLIGGINGLFFAFLLLQLKRENFRANRYLAVILAANGILLLDQFLVKSNLIYEVPALLGAFIPVEAVFPPTLYLYVRTMVQPNVPGQKTLMHFIPTFFCVLMLTPLYFLEFDAKKAIIDSNYIEWPGVLEITYPIYMIVAGTQFTVYLFLSFKLLFAHTKNVTHFFSYRENITLAWLRNFLLFNVVIWVCGAFFYTAIIQSDVKIEQYLDYFFVFSVLFIFYLGTMGLLQQRIYSSDEALSKEPSPLEDSNNIASTPDGKYKKSAVTEEMSARILKRLTETMQEEKPYLNNTLTLPDLAEMVRTAPNYLSQVINEQLQMNFFDYVNSYRIETAKNLIINPLPHTLTILDIAMESAFNSKSAFYSAFKKQVGITPAAFKKSLSL